MDSRFQIFGAKTTPDIRSGFLGIVIGPETCPAVRRTFVKTAGSKVVLCHAVLGSNLRNT